MSAGRLAAVGQDRRREESPDEAVAANVKSMVVRAPKLTYEDEKIKKWGANSREEWLAYIKYVGLSDKISDPDRFFTNELIDEANNFDAQAVIQTAKNYKVQ